MIKGAIFDLDGTLIDSMSIWDNIADDYLYSIGKEPKENLKEKFENFSLKQSAEYYQKYYDVKLSINEIIEGINSIVADFYINKVQMKPGIAKFLENMYEMNIKMCIATATDKNLAKASITRLGLDKYFSEIFTCSSVGYGKDKPDIYYVSEKHLNTLRIETMVFEDALFAIKTAKNEGYITVGVYDEHELKQDELKKYSDIYLQNYFDIDLFSNQLKLF